MTILAHLKLVLVGAVHAAMAHPNTDPSISSMAAQLQRSNETVCLVRIWKVRK